MMQKRITWTDYLKHRAQTRDFDLQAIEDIVRRSAERYYDTATLRIVAVGKHDKRLVLVPYESDDDSLTPITVHAVSRQQIDFRIRTGRFIHE